MGSIVLPKEAKAQIGKALTLAERPLPPVRTQDDFDVAAEDAQSVKREINLLLAHRKTLTEPLDETKKGIMALFKVPLSKLEDYSDRLKSVLGDYMERKQRAEEAERQRRQAVEDRKAAERKAQLDEAAAQARAAAELAEQERRVAAEGVRREEERIAALARAKEMERLREDREAAESLNRADRKKLEAKQAEERKQREKEAAERETERLRQARVKEEEARKRKEDAEGRAAELQARADTTVAEKVKTSQRYERVAGVTGRRVWKWKVSDISELPDTYKEVNGSAITKAMRDSISECGSPPVIPGVEFWQDFGVATGGEKA